MTIFLNPEGGNLGFGSVGFASASEAERVQEEKNGEYLRDKRITLGLAKITPYPQRPRFCREHKIWHEDCIRKECFLMVQEKKNGELLCGHHVVLGVAEIAPLTPLPTMWCIDHKVWYEDYLRGENLLIEEEEAIEEDEAVEGLDDYVEEVSITRVSLWAVALLNLLLLSKQRRC
ncbi:unnamed protein product [Cuscuta campestris]|uniref:RRM domain-containing protein n=1 Tax=Cuscuta campestris TaxID=132261 RepID=A0A484K622_9ASTE|nr:unnamed protein product [Cuscuta campestris]